MLPLDVIGNQLHRPRAIERVSGDQFLDPLGVHLHQQVLHPAGLELEHALRPPLGENLVDQWIIGQVVQVQLYSVVLFDQLSRVVQHRQRSQPQEVHLQQADFFRRTHRVLHDHVVAVLR